MNVVVRNGCFVALCGFRVLGVRVRMSNEPTNEIEGFHRGAAIIFCSHTGCWISRENCLIFHTPAPLLHSWRQILEQGRGQASQRGIVTRRFQGLR